MNAMEDLAILWEYDMDMRSISADVNKAKARLFAICEAFDKAGDVVKLATLVYITVDIATGQDIDKRIQAHKQAADLIRAHVARETVAKDKRIKELEEALTRISCRTDHGEQEPCPICAICDAALAGQAKEEGR